MLRNRRGRQNFARLPAFRAVGGTPSESSRNPLRQSPVWRSPLLFSCPHIHGQAPPSPSARLAIRIPAYPTPKATPAPHRLCPCPSCAPAPRAPGSIAGTHHQLRQPAAARRPQSSLLRSRFRPCAPQTQSAVSPYFSFHRPGAAPDSPPHLSLPFFEDEDQADSRPRREWRPHARSLHTPP